MAWQTRLTPELARFVAEQDHFYLGTANAAGRPYIQHRGGPKGFLKVLGENRLGFADFAGNQQFVTLGHLAENPQAFLFLIDYPARRRVKIRGQARAVADDPALARSLADPAYPGRVERAILIDIDEWDANCPSHILPRWDAAALTPAFERLEARIRALETQVRALGGDPGAFDMPA
ncbi:pyridoxamine 5'-phosphate oxidase family protein [uncultured Parvibaculum sp.]|uniref:pyridoxamine 5'-phosphate oxidase family protein n=1 Tax=uncultured Parvibaculum sp. TaxID=291828 RepID=UPI0030D8C096|tara:strand:- start:56528 stop:57058 length:531 start_codon:yes stop_codon:yes gene_type:complete